MSNTLVSRRKALIGGAALPLAASGGAAFAKAEMQGASTPNFTRFKLGSFEVTTLLDSSSSTDNPQTIFGMNATEDEFAAASAAAFIPSDKVQFFFTPTLVNTGQELILFDTGFGPGLAKAMAAAGYSADQVDKVVLTHMHGDHIAGLANDAGPTFANATYFSGAAEDNHWSQAENKTYEGKVRPLLEKTTMLDDGGTVASGVTAQAAFGHTPGHLTYMLESEGQQLLVAGDTANHYIWSLAHPDWEVKFDMDKAAAAATRRKVFGMLAADRVPFIGYHMPFPGIGYVEINGDGFRYVPLSYQHML